MKISKIVFFVTLSLIFIINCSKNTSSISKSINIGAVLPLTGNIAPYGQSSKMGMEIALEEMLKKNPEMKKINVIFEDGKGIAKESVNAIKKLIEINNTPVVLGGIASSIALAMAPIAENSKTVLMCPFASSPKITYAGDYIFRIMPSDAFQGALLPKYIKKFGYNRIAIIYVKNDWGESLKDAFVKEFRKNGGKVVLVESCNEGSKDLRNLVAKINEIKNKIDGLFLPTYPEEGGLLLKQLKESNINLPIFGGDTWANELLIKIAGKASENVIFLAPMQYEGNEYQIFRNNYFRKFNKEPDLPAAAGYDAMKVVLFVIKKLIDNQKKITGEEIKNELYKIKDFKGATGITTFDENGDVISKEFALRIIKNGKIRYYEK